MGETEVRSPVCRPGSAVGSRQSTDLSPGARSNPSRGDAQQAGIVRGVHAEPPRAHEAQRAGPGRATRCTGQDRRAVGIVDRWTVPA